MSTEPKFTPGPWEIREMGEGDERQAMIFCGGGASKRNVALTTRRCTKEEKSCILADARLIAAAPNLFEACKEVADEIEGCFSEVELLNDESLLGGFRDKLRAALAKALGQ